MASPNRKQKSRFDGGGLVLFIAVPEAMEAQRVLKKAGYWDGRQHETHLR